MESFPYDNSQLQTYKDCPERYRLKYVLGLSKREEEKEEHSRNFGKAIHAALERRYKGASWDEIKGAFTQNYPEQLDVRDLARTQENGITLLEAYINHYQAEDKTIKILAVEVADTFMLPNGLLFMVKIDLIIEKQGLILFMDHKTTGKSLNWTYWEQFEPNSQITAYSAYCLDKYKECSGGISNAMRFGYRQRMYKGEPAGFYWDFQRQVFSRNHTQIKAWVKDTMGWIDKIEKSKAGGIDEPWSKNEGQCLYCSYKPVCIGCGDAQIIDNYYEKGDPFEYLKEGQDKETLAK